MLIKLVIFNNSNVFKLRTLKLIKGIAILYILLLDVLNILIFLCLVFRVFKKVSYLEDECLKLILVGSVMLLLFQVLVHIGVNIRFLPTTGMTLPFLSYGGSSIISVSILSGIILNLTKRKVLFSK